jgi:uncharacterized integral membrane protein
MKKKGKILLGIGIAAFVGIFVLVFIMMNVTRTTLDNTKFESNMTLGFVVLTIVFFVGVSVGPILIIKSKVKEQLAGSLGMLNQSGIFGHMSQMMKTPQSVGTAKVITVIDTGKVLGANPIVSMQLEINIPNHPKSTYQMETPVQSSAVPQVGDTISIGVMPDKYIKQVMYQQKDWIYMGIINKE